MKGDLARSVHVRLIRHAKALNVDPNFVLARYAMERLLYRLSRSPYADRFVLKGGLLLFVWLGETIRPTRDVDLLGFGELSADALTTLFAEVCEVDVEPDGLTFDADSIRVGAIRTENPYGGQRATLRARLGPARLRVQVDVGIGDAVVPEPQWLVYPSLLDFPRPRLRAYRAETSIAEKVHAMVVLGSKNSRLRDFFDVHALAAGMSFEGVSLSCAMGAVFERRGTPIPTSLPLALTQAFVEVEDKRAQWAGFLRRSRLTQAPVDFAVVVAEIADFIAPVFDALACGEELLQMWPPAGPWAPA